jgi:hypothetical protein
MKRHIDKILLFAGLTLSAISYAASYDIGSSKIVINEPKGFFSLKATDGKAFSDFYVKVKPDLIDFFCYEGIVPEGSCNYHRVVYVESFRKLSNVDMDYKLFEGIKTQLRSRLLNECSECLERAKKTPGVSDVKFDGIFSDTDKYLGYSLIFQYADYKSVDSIMGVLVKGKLLLFHATSHIGDDKDIEWAKETLVKWAKQVVSDNS